MTTVPYGYPIAPRKVYLIGFNPNTLGRDSLTAFLEQSPVSLNWITLLPGQVFCVSERTVAELAASIRANFPNQFVFITEVNQVTCDGWMPRDIWNFINNPSSAKQQPAPDYLKLLYNNTKSS